MSEPQWCPVHQHFKWCEHNGGCGCEHPLKATGWHAPPEGESPEELAHLFTAYARLVRLRVEQEVTPESTERSLQEMSRRFNEEREP